MFKYNQSDNHTYLNLSLKQLKLVYNKLQQYITTNRGKLPFYFCYSDKSKDYCQKLAGNLYQKLNPFLWETYYPSFDHHFHDHGCFVKMSDATSRKYVYTMELESQKHFFNIFEEIEKSKLNPKYFENKLNYINLSLKLALEAIKEMIRLF